jgi:hypothetical protein
LGAHCQNVMRYFFRRLHLLECQLDELWTFIAKKEALSSAIIGSLHCRRVGAQTLRTELGVKQHWTLDFRAGIIARDNTPSRRGIP